MLVTLLFGNRVECRDRINVIINFTEVLLAVASLYVSESLFINGLFDRCKFKANFPFSVIFVKKLLISKY